MSNTTPTAIRLSITDDISNALSRAKIHYPTLSDPEILKLGLSKIIREIDIEDSTNEKIEIMRLASKSVGADYLSDPEEDVYSLNMGKKVHFS